MRRSIQLCLSLLAVLTLFASAVTTAAAHEAGTVYLKVNKAHTSKPSRGSNLYYHGGPIESAVAVYIVWWGPQWAGSGFSTGGYSSAQAQTYVSDFFGNVGGTSWAASTKQYCSGVAFGTTQCGAAGTHPSAGVLSGTLNDRSSVPASPTQSQIAAEAAKLASSFGGVNPNADYMVFTPTGHSENGFGASWCAYHSSTSSGLSYSYIPYQPDAGGGCGMNFVNATNTSYGEGYFDGFSIVGGHEYAETITDPQPNSGWLDRNGAENGDKCAWIAPGSGSGGATNLSWSGHAYAVQSLWSNLANGGSGGCVTSS